MNKNQDNVYRLKLDIVRHAMSLEPGALDTYLARCCNEHPGLIEEVKQAIESIRARKKRTTEAAPIEIMSVALSAQNGASPLPQLPEEIAGCKIRRILGSGSIGIVYQAWDEKLERDVAVKTLVDSIFPTEEHRVRLTREAQSTADLKHQNIVGIYKVEKTSPACPIPCLILELIRGPNLRDYRPGKRWGADDAANLIYMLATATQYAHERNVYHRDLKPSNVLLHYPNVGEDLTAPSILLDGDRVVPKIADFSLGKRVEDVDHTKPGVILGTPRFASPELLRGESRTADARADVYGLGAILYWLLTNKPPFDGKTDLEVSNLVSDPDQEPIRPRTLVHDIPPILEAICLRCLAKLPDARYATAGQLAKDLHCFLNGEPTLAAPEEGFNRFLGLFARNPRMAPFQGWKPLLFIAAVLGFLDNTGVYVMQGFQVPAWIFQINGGILLAVYFTFLFFVCKTTQPGTVREGVLLALTGAVISAVLVTVITSLYLEVNMADDNLGWPFFCICNLQACVVLAHRLKMVFLLTPVVFCVLAFVTAADRERAPLWFGVGWFVSFVFAGLAIPKQTSGQPNEQ